jgi:hypothetical protein
LAGSDAVHRSLESRAIYARFFRRLNEAFALRLLALLWWFLGGHEGRS